MRRRRSTLLGLAAVAIASAALVGPTRFADARADASDGRPITVNTRTVAVPERLMRRSPARFLAGLALSASDPAFGGISGIALDGDRLLAIGDRGLWLSLALERDPDGAIRDVRRGEAGRLKDRSGVTLRGRGADAESLAADPAGGWWIGFEGRHRITRRETLDGPAVAEAVQLPTRRLSGNGGIEGLAIARDGAVWAISEEPSADRRSILGWRMIGGRAEPFAIARSDDFRATGADFGPDGALYLLERRFGFFSGIAMRIRRFSADQLAAVDGSSLARLGAGESLVTLDQRGPVDNMEGLAVERRDDGAILLTAISDDNFGALQRTVLLQFVVPPAQSNL